MYLCNQLLKCRGQVEIRNSQMNSFIVDESVNGRTIGFHSWKTPWSLSVLTSSFYSIQSWRPQGLCGFSRIKGDPRAEAGLALGLPDPIPRDGMWPHTSGTEGHICHPAHATPVYIWWALDALPCIPPSPPILLGHPEEPHHNIPNVMLEEQSLLTKRGKGTVFQPHGLSFGPEREELNNKSSRIQNQGHQRAFS